MLSIGDILRPCRDAFLDRGREHPAGRTRRRGLLVGCQLEHPSPVRLVIDADDPDTGQPEKQGCLLGHL